MIETVIALHTSGSGREVGFFDGCRVGLKLLGLEGFVVGLLVTGFFEGCLLGIFDGCRVGLGVLGLTIDGFVVGLPVTVTGFFEGCLLGVFDGRSVGLGVIGSVDGCIVGCSKSLSMHHTIGTKFVQFIGYLPQMLVSEMASQ